MDFLYPTIHALSLPGAKVPNRERSPLRTFAPRNFRSHELPSPGTFAPGNESSMELLLPISKLVRLSDTVYVPTKMVQGIQHLIMMTD